MKEIPESIPLAKIPMYPSSHEIRDAEPIFQVRLRCDLFHVWFLRIALVVAGDASYNDVHLYLVESNVQTRREWMSALDTIERLKPRAVIAGHKKAEKDDSPRIIEETRQYIRDFERLAEMTTTARELYDKMLELYPDRANPGSLWGSAHVARP